MEYQHRILVTLISDKNTVNQYFIAMKCVTKSFKFYAEHLNRKRLDITKMFLQPRCQKITRKINCVKKSV